MKSKTISREGLPLTRINYSNAWNYITKNNGCAIAVLYSYETPIMIVTYDGECVVVWLNENAYGYSRTTSKHISQWISSLHLFTTWGYKLPWGFRDIAKENYELCDGACAIPIDTNELEIRIVQKYTLCNLCSTLASRNKPAMGLTDVASI